MTNEELERTGVLKAILDKDIENEDTTIGERIEEFEDKLEYIDIADDIKEKYKELISKIKEEKEDSVKEYLFNELIKML